MVTFRTTVSGSHRWFQIITACALFARCKCGGSGAVDAGSWIDAPADVNVPRAAEIEELWIRAKDGDDDEVARLAAGEGIRGLEERAAMPAYRVTALRAMGYAPGYSALAMLGSAAARGNEAEARAAVASADTIAARKRAQTELADAEELAAGCVSLLGAAKDAARPRDVRVGAVRALRMLADGQETRCVKLTDIPKDVDVH